MCVTFQTSKNKREVIATPHFLETDVKKPSDQFLFFWSHAECIHVFRYGLRR